MPSQETSPKLAAVKTLYDVNPLDVVKTLRRIADNIEKGEYGEVKQLALVLLGDELETFSMGETDLRQAHYLFSVAARSLESPIIR